MPSKLKNFFNKNDVVEVNIDDMGMNGEGVAHAEGAVIFVRGAITGERVRAKIIYVGKSYCVALLDKILKCSPYRKDAPCPYFPKCGGCTLQHINYDAQVDFKTESLKNTLKKQGIDAKCVQSAVKSDKEYFYRNKLTLPVRYPNKIGFFKSESHSLVDVDDCMLQNFDCKSIVASLKDFMTENSLSGYDEESGTGDVRHLSVRNLNGKYYICIVATHNISGKLSPLLKKIETTLSENFSLWLNINTKRTNVIFSDEFIFVGGKENLETCLSELKLTPHPAAFFQVNDFIREELYSAAASEVKNFPFVIDAYSGAGILSAKLAEKAEKVVAVEINEKAHDAAKSLISANGIKNLTPICGDCAKELGKILSDANRSENTALVLDPPRAGVDKSVIDAVTQAKPDKIIYISCNAATLARDLKLLRDDCYEIEFIRPYDMFPQTPSLEILSSLKLKK